MEPLVSILIPAYNAEEWLANTLQSALAQTWANKEIIVVDDGSKDRTSIVARRFEACGVRLIRQQNQGAAAARNTAFSACSGDFIQWLDADDLLAPGKIASQMKVIGQCGNPRILASGPWGAFYYRFWRAKFIPTDLWCDLSPAEWMLRKMGRNLHMQTGTWLISRELSLAAGPWDTNMHVDDDGEYLCRVLTQCERIRFVQEAQVYYRSLGASSLSYIGNSSRKMEAQLRSMELHVKCLLALEDSPRSRLACLAYLQCWVGAFYPMRLDLAERADQIAQNLGYRLTPPMLSWKYKWIQTMFGNNVALRMKAAVPRTTGSLKRFWDKILLIVDKDPSGLISLSCSDAKS